MFKEICNDPTCKEHFCQISGARLKGPCLNPWQKIEKRIEELDIKLIDFIDHYNHDVRKRIEVLESDLGDLKDKVEGMELDLIKRIEELENRIRPIPEFKEVEEKYDLSFVEAMSAVREGKTVSHKSWFNAEGKYTCDLPTSNEWRIVRD